MSDAMRPFNEVLGDRHGYMRKLKSERGRKVAGYFCDYVPEEILWAGGMDTVRITGESGNITVADHYLQSNVCSFARRCFEQAMNGTYSYLDGVVVPHTCDIITKIYDLWAYRMKDPEFLHYVWVPHKVFDKDAPGVMIGEIKRLRQCTEKAIGREITDDQIREAVAVYDRSRTLLREVYQLRMDDPPRISGVEAFAVALTSLLTPKDVHNKWMEDLLAERRAGGPALEKRPRVLVVASMLDDLSFVAAVEDAGAWVVSEDLCSSTRYFYDRVGDLGDNPVKALSHRYLNKLPCPRSIGSLGPRREHILAMVKDYKVSGVIFYILRCCDAQLFQYPLLRERLQQEGQSLLYIQGDQTVGVNEPIQNRIKAFTEMLSS